MQQLNLILLEGHLTHEPEFRQTDSGLAMCRFTVANNASWKKDGETHKEVSFLNVVAWSRVAETCRDYLHKGSPVRVRGRVDQKKVQTKDGRSVSVVDVVAQSVDFLPKRRSEQDAPDAAEAAA